LEATDQNHTELLKDLAAEIGKLPKRVREKIPQGERERVRGELVTIAERLVSKYALSIPDARRVLHEVLDVSV
jgi:hypothetical protein